LTIDGRRMLASAEASEFEWQINIVVGSTSALVAWWCAGESSTRFQLPRAGRGERRLGVRAAGGVVFLGYCCNLVPCMGRVVLVIRGTCD
jgi:hypothetical protein